MDKKEIYEKAVALCIGENEETRRFFIEPMWREILEDDGITFSEEEAQRILEMLKLVVKKADVLHDRTGTVVNWLYDVITANIEPTVLKEETEYIQNVMDYMKLNNQLKDKEKELSDREHAMDSREDVEEMFPQMEFGKL